MSEIRTSELNDSLNNDLEQSTKLRDRVFSFLKKARNFVRRFFAISSERSVVASFVETLYSAVLSCKARILATFLFSFSAISLIIGYLINSSLNYFISDINTYFSSILLVVSLLLFTCRVSLHELISTSKILSKLSLVYNQQNSLFSISKERYLFEFNYSTAFFIGVITGIFSAIYPVTSILSFVIFLFFVIFILNLPECGILTTLFLVPFIDTNIVVAFILVTFISFIYKFLIGKRHMDLGIAEILILICVFYVCFNGTFAIKSSNFRTMLCCVAFFLSCMFSANLIRTTVMFRRVLNVLIRMTRVYAVMLLLFYIFNFIFSPERVSVFLNSLKLESVVSSLCDYSFIAPFLIMAIPLNFSNLLSAKKKQDFFVNTFFVIVLSFCALFVATFSYILVVTISIVVLLFFYKKRFVFLLFSCPFAAYLGMKLLSKVPENFFITLKPESSFGLKENLTIIKEHLIFGAGLSPSDNNALALIGGQNSVVNILIYFGIAGFTIFAATMIIMLIKSFKSLSARTIHADKARILSAGLICSTLSFLAISIFGGFMADFRCIYLFAVILSLSYTAVRCYESDYIDPTIIREYIK